MPDQVIDFSTLDTVVFNGTDLTEVIFNGASIWTYSEPSNIIEPNSFEFLTIGDAGNVADTTTYGAVDYEFEISKYAVSEADINQYNELILPGSLNPYSTKGSTLNNISNLQNADRNSAETHIRISADGNRFIAGDPLSKIARVYEWSGSAWTQLGSDFGPSPEISDLTGISVDINEDGSRVIFSSQSYDITTFSDNGRVQVFERIESTNETIGIYFWNDTAKKIQKMDLDGGNVTDILTNPFNTAGVEDIRIKNNQLYFITTDDGGEIWRCDLDGGNLVNIVDNLPDAQLHYGLDITDEYIYVASDSGDAIHRYNLDGTLSQGGLISSSDPTTSVDVTDDFIYYNRGNSIYRANLDGTNDTRIIASGFVSEMDKTWGLFVNDNYIYWIGRANDGDESIWRSNLDGTNITVILHQDLGSFDRRIRVTEDKIYFSLYASGVNGGVFSCNLDGSNLQTLISTSAAGLEVIAESWRRLGSDFLGASNDEIGQNVAINSTGNRIAYCVDNLNQTFVYEWSGSAWNAIGTIPTVAAQRLNFNSAGDRIIIGGSINLSGIVKVYEYAGGSTWNQLGSDFTGDNGSLSKLGRSVDINAVGDIIVIGASSYADTVASDAGSVVAYKWTGTSWSQLGERMEGAGANDYWGEGLAINAAGTQIVIGTQEGKIEVFQWNSSNWINSHTITDATINNWGRRVTCDASGATIISNSSDGSQLRVKESPTLQITLDYVNGTNKPVTGISWNKAARYVNWLNEREGQQPAYKFTTGGVNDNIELWAVSDDGYDPNNLFRNSYSKYFIPSEDEWYKAAYYKSGSTNAGYWLYPTGSDTAPTAVVDGTTTGTAVYDGQSGPADVTKAGGLSPYGTMGQGGNTYEYSETARDGNNDSAVDSRANRGGYWLNPSDVLQSSYRGGGSVASGGSAIGFRVAKRTAGQTIEFVTIGDAGNAPVPYAATDPGVDDNLGAVDYAYCISKYALSVPDLAQYKEGLGSGSYSSYFTYAPVMDVYWYSLARYVNWLNEEEGEQPAYKFDESSGHHVTWSSSEAWQLGGENLYRHKDAKYFIPSEDEWYKAAGYDPNKPGGAGYWAYATGSDTAPTSVASGTDPNTAVYDRSAPVGSGTPPPAPVNESGGLSPYGTMGQLGNVWELLEGPDANWLPVIPGDQHEVRRPYRGGSWLTDNVSLRYSEGAVQTYGIGNQTGARIAKRYDGGSAI